jgi:hypothetical protein
VLRQRAGDPEPAFRGEAAPERGENGLGMLARARRRRAFTTSNALEQLVRSEVRVVLALFDARGELERQARGEDPRIVVVEPAADDGHRRLERPSRGLLIGEAMLRDTREQVVHADARRHRGHA